ncbi:MAG: SGNH/GDSL hydrolase family protein [Clostridia bacterium]|nr:SGNH/GDSL hydrolase family protein [Clostridia bacterium]
MKKEKMKKILLIGDSVRIGYDAYVREGLKRAAEVSYPEENCTSSYWVLRNLHIWADELEVYDADLVHFNAGHWDTLRIYGDPPITPIGVYKENLVRIVRRIRFLFPRAKLIFALSTPVIESGFIEGFECRLNRDIEEYNRIAVEALSEFGVIINDLYSPLSARPGLHSDQTHFFTADGTGLIGGLVTDAVCGALGLDRSKLAVPDKAKFEITKYKNDRELYVKKGDYYVPVIGI